MYCVRNIKEDIIYVGASDRRISMFENAFPVPNGIAYNSYLILDEKTVLLDTVDSAVEKPFMQNIEHVLNGRKLDYLVINHMEPDHCGTLQAVIEKYPDMKVIGNTKTIALIKQFFDFEIDYRAIVIKDKDVISTGKHELHFLMAPMVHWPETMVTYDSTDKILFSADAFGSFGALSGNIFDDETEFMNTWLDEARRYYTNIVGKYGVQVQNMLKKLADFEIDIIAPLHGPIIRSNVEFSLDKYDIWSKYESEVQSVMIAFASIYGGTENAVNILAYKLGDMGINNIVVHDVSRSHVSEILSDAFKYSHIVFASPTYNNGIFHEMEGLLLDLKAHNFSNKTVAVMENGSWSPAAGKLIKAHLETMKNINILEETITVKSTVKDYQAEEFDKLAKSIVKTIKK